ncbi:hypothetical protein CPAR01_07438 [Colletotrichum paranaense]|uniref:Secreted protein n=1 Tax=Colletotrichum paranaense TaxID=1914294 RepID=A0ABQ9SQH0_9PEZI|nr:uncharacterized protein CPAR01_07438 [Colletotrichum paranaense]KAK1541449.1 hypothetical protein CPAR01_07438 [Colletotrichum paranaense]
MRQVTFLPLLRASSDRYSEYRSRTGCKILPVKRLAARHPLCTSSFVRHHVCGHTKTLEKQTRTQCLRTLCSRIKASRSRYEARVVQILRRESL